MEKKFFFMIACAALFLSAGISFAAEPSVEASLDKTRAYPNEEIYLSVRITGAKGSLDRPKLPSLESFEIFYSGRSSQFSFVNGRSESFTEFSYVLVPRAPGQFVLRPIEIAIADKVYQSNELEIQVLDRGGAGAASGPVTPQRTIPQQPLRTYPSAPVAPSGPPAAAHPPQAGATTSLDTSGADENIFLRVEPSTLSVYNNEQLLLTYSLLTRYDTRYEGFEEEPETSGFWIEEFPMEQNLGRDTEVVKGRRYVRADVKKLALFPTSPGEYIIKPGTIKTSVEIQERNTSIFDEFFSDSFFSGAGLFARRVQKLLTAPPIKILVKPLPEAGKPQSFNGAVGEFRMATEVDKRLVNQNEAVTLKITIEGEGNIETVAAPVLPGISDTKIYPADIQTQLFRSRDVIAGKKTFEIIVIPAEPDELVIPKLEFSFFQPSRGRYVTLQSDAYQIKVNPSKTPPPVLPDALAEEKLRPEKKEIKQESEDILYIKERVGPEGFLTQPRFVFWFAVLNGGLTLLALALLGLRQRETYFETHIDVKRNLFARRYATQRFKDLNRMASSEKHRLQFFEQSARVLSQYLADKLNLSAQGLTQHLVEEALLRRGASPEVIALIQKCYEQCDQVRFGGVMTDVHERRAMLEALQEIVRRLEK